MLAALPLVLMLSFIFRLWLLPVRVNSTLPATAFLVLGISLATGLCVLFYVFVGWMRGLFAFKRGDILLATTLASLDVLIPTTLAVLLWLIIRSLRKHPGLIF
jgi:hypothetical protein